MMDQARDDLDGIKTGALSMTLTKAHIVEAVAKQNGYPKNQSIEMVDTLLEIIKRTLESGEDVLNCRFGKFCKIWGQIFGIDESI